MIPNQIGGRWERPNVKTQSVYNPATGEVIGEVPLSGPEQIDAAVRAAAAAYPEWSTTPVMERTRLMFRFKALLEDHFEEIAAEVTLHHGKTLGEARGEVRRGIEVVDFACGAPTLLQGRTLRQVSRGVDQDLYRYPVGVCAGIPPFNFPTMIPLWMFPLAVVCGNTYVMKPSERTPLSVVRLAGLFQEAGFPDGVLNVVHGAAEAASALIAHPDVRAISFVGSEPIARAVYRDAAAHGKRVQALGGAKNHIVIVPDADFETTIPAILGSAFGNADLHPRNVNILPPKNAAQRSNDPRLVIVTCEDEVAFWNRFHMVVVDTNEARMAVAQECARDARQRLRCLGAKLNQGKIIVRLLRPDFAYCNTLPVRQGRGVDLIYWYREALAEQPSQRSGGNEPRVDLGHATQENDLELDDRPWYQRRH